MTGHDGYDSISVSTGGDDPDTVKAAVPKELGRDFLVRTGKEAAEQQAQDLSDALGFIRTALLVFAGGRAARRRLPDLQHVHGDRRAADEGVRAAAGARRLARAGAALGADRDVRRRPARVDPRRARRARPGARAGRDAEGGRDRPRARPGSSITPGDGDHRPASSALVATMVSGFVPGPPRDARGAGDGDARRA